MFFENWDAMKPGDIVELAPIEFEATNANNADLIWVSLYAHNMPQQLIGFFAGILPNKRRTTLRVCSDFELFRNFKLRVSTNGFEFSFPKPMRWSSGKAMLC